MILIGALLVQAPLFSQIPALAGPQLRNGEIQWFNLTESKNEIRRALGPPLLAAAFGDDFESWQYRFGEGVDHDEFTHYLVFRKSTGQLISVTRNDPEDPNVDPFFPRTRTETYCTSSTGAPPFCVRVRRLSGGRLLISTGQLVLIRQSELAHFYPWLSPKLQSPLPPTPNPQPPTN